MFYKEIDTRNYLHYTSLHPNHCKRAVTYSQFLRLRRICSADDDFATKATEMKDNFLARGFPENQLNNDLRRVATVTRAEALTRQSRNVATDDRVPLVLTYNPFNTRTRRIMIGNFNILTTDPETRSIFPELPLVSYRRDRNLRDILVHSVQGSTSSSDAGSSPCRHPRCQTCKYITPQTVIQGPKSSYTIRDRFTYQSENVVYCITCHRCTSIYIGETGRVRFSEHLRSIRKRSTGFPVADHFNSDAHSVDDIMVCGMK